MPTTNQTDESSNQTAEEGTAQGLNLATQLGSLSGFRPCDTSHCPEGIKLQNKLMV
jgi:hypothetical protein